MNRNKNKSQTLTHKQNRIMPETGTPKTWIGLDTRRVFLSSDIIKMKISFH